MVKQSMFDKIKLLQRQGYSIIEISAKLSLNRKTVSKYFHMPENDYKKYLLKMSYKEKVFEIYKRDIMFIYSANDNIKLNMCMTSLKKNMGNYHTRRKLYVTTLII